MRMVHKNESLGEIERKGLRECEMCEVSLICFPAVSCRHRNVFTSPCFAISDTRAPL